MHDDDFFYNSKYVKELTEDNFDGDNLINKECSIVMFYCSWCMHCQNLKGIWENLGKIATYFNVYAFNCTDGKLSEKRIYKINSFPTIIIYIGSKPHIYEGERTLKSFVQETMNVCNIKNHKTNKNVRR